MADSFAMLSPFLMLTTEISPNVKICITMMVFLVSFALKYLKEHRVALDALFKWCQLKKENSYVLKARIAFKQNIVYDSDITQQFKAIQRKLFLTMTADQRSTIDYTINEHKINGEALQFICFNSKYEVESDILIKHNFSEEKSDKEDFTFSTYTFVLTSKSNNFSNVIHFINESTDSYDEDMVSKMPQKIWTLDGFCGRDKMHPIYSDFAFQCNKTFDNVFFDQKDLLIKTIRDFENNRGVYTKLGLPYSHSFFFWGSHGVGKTSCAKAIAALTQRHVVLVSLSKIKTAKQFFNIFMEEYISGVKIPMNKKLFVFDDFDCRGWQEIIKPREGGGGGNGSGSGGNGNSGSSSKSDLRKLAKAISKSNNEDFEDDADANKAIEITLGDILEIIDGFIEMPGRMAIFITNHPENIDPAFMRRGRMNTIMEIKKLQRKDIADIYKLWFDKEIPAEVLNHVKNLKYTQADIGDLFKSHDFDLIHKAIVS